MARNKPVNPAAAKALDNFKFEVASELGIANKVNTQGWASMSSRECGMVGGNMVKKMIQQAEARLGGGTQ